MKKNKKKATHVQPPKNDSHVFPKPTKTVYPTLRQLVNLIPCKLIEKVAHKHQVRFKTFTPTSHVLSLMFFQITKISSLNELCDALHLHASEFHSIRRAEPPNRNTLSHANAVRPAAMAEELYWSVFSHLRELAPGFGESKRIRGFLSRLKKRVFAVDSTTIRLAMNCLAWARHRRRKAAAKLHMMLDVSTGLPSFAIFGKASQHDSRAAGDLTADLHKEDICVADRAYTDFGFMSRLDSAGVFFVVRQKENMRLDVVGPSRGKHGPPIGSSEILADEEVRPALEKAARKYTGRLRRVRAIVEVDGKRKEMTFLTNNFSWSPRTVAELYRSRWSVELFFKELKQTCQLEDFIGYSENAVMWQVWTALLVHLLLRFVQHMGKWELSFSRLAGVVRSAVWVRRNLWDILKLYGTASPGKRCVIVGKAPYVQGFFNFTNNPVG